MGKEKFWIMVTSDYEKTGLLYVDMVAAAVSHYRRLMRPIKTIYLHPKGYTQFSDWTRHNLDKIGKHEEAAGIIEKITFDGVEVAINNKFMGERIYFDFYPAAGEA